MALMLVPIQLSPVVIVRRFSRDVVGPKVREMDENEQMDPAVIQGLFEQGVSSKSLMKDFRIERHSSHS